MNVLLTGGAGYIGLHTAVELSAKGFNVIIADDYSNSKPEAVKRAEQIAGATFKVYELDVADFDALDKMFCENTIDSVIHFAGYKAVGESVTNPIKYYENNLGTTLTLLKVMEKYGVNKLVFSSSATVYGIQESPQYVETMSTSCINPYGWTKLMSEQIFRDACNANKNLSVVLLRYFNPIGAHESGLIGEDPQGIPNNLMPFITQVAVGKLPQLNIFGNDYNTPDGTCIRDYIHVVDLAKGHVCAIDYTTKFSGIDVFNLGGGKGYSVLEIVNAFMEANDMKIPYVFAPRRAGDLDEFFANPKKAKDILGWQTEKTIVDMCKDSWRWQTYAKTL